MSENRVKRAIDTDLSGLRTTARQREQIVQYALEGQNPMSYRSKLRVSIVLAIALVLITAVTALAVGLTSYFSGFAELESEYGEYEQWPGSAKVQLVELMLESGVLTAEDTPQWTDDLTGEAKEAAAEEILGVYFDGMIYVDTYNATTRVLGPIEQWTDEQRVMYTELLEKYGKLTDSWPVFQLPGNGDLTRDQAVARAKEALLGVFDIDAEYLDSLPVDALFRADAYNGLDLPEDEPYWTVELGYGVTSHLVDMTRHGEILSIAAPQTGKIIWGTDITAQSIPAEPGEYDATRDEVIAAARSGLTEVGSIGPSSEDADALTPTVQFVWNNYYFNGYEPVWIVTWSLNGEPQYQVLLTHDAQYLDTVHCGKLFSNVLRREPHLDEIVAEMFGVQSYEIMALREASLEEKARFYELVKPIADEYAAAHPYFADSERAKAMNSWQYTRNVLGIPDNVSIDASRALGAALDAYEAKYGYRVESSSFPGIDATRAFYIVTNPDKPQWRFIHAGFCAAVDAHTGDVLCVYNRNDHIGMDEFIGEIIE